MPEDTIIFIEIFYLIPSSLGTSNKWKFGLKSLFIESKSWILNLFAFGMTVAIDK